MGYLQIKGGQLWCGDSFTSNEEIVYELPKERDRTMELADDDFIIPGGLIDMHAHLWAPPAVSSFGVAEEKLFTDGFVGALDAGTYGVNDWESADRYFQNGSMMQVKSFLSILPEGLTIFPPVNPSSPDDVDEDKYVAVINRNKDTALGVKVQLGWLNYKSVETDTQLLTSCRNIADRTGTNVMVHISGQCMSAQASANMLKEKDILTHPYSGFANTILNERGSVYQEILDAKKRGVIFDVGYAGKHFSWKVFRQAYDQGIIFDTLGMDIPTVIYRTPNSAVVDQFFVISGMLNANVDKNVIFRAMTTNPAKYLGFTLDRKQNCVVLKKYVADAVAVDGQGDRISVKFEYKPMAVVNRGRLLQYKEN